MSKNEIRESQVWSKISRITTPFIIASAFCLFHIVAAAIDIDRSEGWSFIGIMIYFPALLILLSLDFIFRITLKDKTLQLWIIETILLIIGIWYFVNFIIGP